MDHARCTAFSRLVLLLSGCCLATLAYADHPLLTEDTVTQGKGKSLVELTYEYSKNDVAGGREIGRDTALVLSHGLSDPLDVILSIPHSSVSVAGAPTVSGIGDVEFSAKWRFYDRDELSFAIRPGMTLTTGDETQGLGTGKHTYSLFAIMSYDTDSWGIHTHIGITDNRNVLGEREHITHLSAAATRRITDKLELVADISHETNTDITSGNDIESAVVGLIYAVADRVNLDIGYRAGISDSAADDTWLLGVAMQF